MCKRIYGEIWQLLFTSYCACAEMEKMGQGSFQNFLSIFLLKNTKSKKSLFITKCTKVYKYTLHFHNTLSIRNVRAQALIPSEFDDIRELPKPCFESQQ